MPDTRTSALGPFSGYHDCPCRDCFEIAIGGLETLGVYDDEKPGLCNECDGCSPLGDDECSSPHAYGQPCGDLQCCDPLDYPEFSNERLQNPIHC